MMSAAAIFSLLMQCSAQLLGKNGKLGFDDKG
jgi:hypothetical protein